MEVSVLRSFPYVGVSRLSTIELPTVRHIELYILGASMDIIGWTQATKEY